jgi:hypothetical protein
MGTLDGVWWDDDAKRLTVAPRLDDASAWLRMANVRCGASVCDVKARLRADALEMRIWCRIGPPVWVTAAPWLPAEPESVRVDDVVLQSRITPDGDGVRASIDFQASGEHELLFNRE